MEQDNYITRINNAFNTDEIDKIPTILYYQDGELVYVVERDDDHMINAGDLQKLLDIDEYEAQQRPFFKGVNYDKCSFI